MLRVAELCAGCGGLFAALQLAGVDAELAWYAETDADACTVMAAHHPDAHNAGDITTAQFSAQEPVDILAGGWPCQPASAAGQRRGSADERWLWPDMARAIRVLQPTVFFGENVPGLLTIEGGLLFGGVLADLDALGYTVRWTTVGACKVGLCHHRHRVFLAAARGAAVELDRWPCARLVDGRWETAADTLFGAGLPPVWPAAGVVAGGLVWALPAEPCGVTSGVAMLPTPRASDTGTEGRRPGGGWRPPLSAVLLPTPTARDGMSGPGHAASAEGAPDLRTVVATSLLPTPTATYWARNATAVRSAPKSTTNADSWTLADVAYTDRWREYGPAVRRHELVLGRAAPEPTEPNTNGGRRLAAPFPEWMQTLPAGWVANHVPRNPALRLIGNGVAPLQGSYAWRLLSAALPTPTPSEVTP